MLELKEEGEDDKVDIYSIEGKLEVFKNKIVVEFWVVILRLLNEVVKKVKLVYNVE